MKKWQYKVYVKGTPRLLETNIVFADTKEEALEKAWRAVQDITFLRGFLSFGGIEEVECRDNGALYTASDPSPTVCFPVSQ